MDALAVQAPAAARAAAGLPGAAIDISLGDMSQARFHLAALSQHDRYGWIEIRVLRKGPPIQRFFSTFVDAANFAVEVGKHADAYVGVVPRRLRQGGRDALVPKSHFMWVECDTSTSLTRALDMALPPQLVIRSSPGKGHCYWPLAEPLALDWLEKANRRLAWALGADMKATDAARILRVAGTRNHKYEDAPRVSITWCKARKHDLARELVGDLPDPAPPRVLPAPRPRRDFGPDPERDRLVAVPARQYVAELTGREVLRGMACCPFHKGGQERTPSLHVDGGDDALYFCFGCNEGGDVFSFAARLWGLDERRDFPELKKRLAEALR